MNQIGHQFGIRHRNLVNLRSITKTAFVVLTSIMSFVVTIILLVQIFSERVLIIDYLSAVGTRMEVVDIEL